MRVIAGPEKKTRVMCEKERLITAYHEMGHAIVGHCLEHCRPGPQDLDHQPRPGARLHDLAADRGQVPHHARRAARHDGDDARRPRRRGDRLRRDHHRRLERPREGHRRRPSRWSCASACRERLGPRVFGHDRGQPFLGREFSSEPDYSDEIAREIDDEIRRIVEAAHQTRQGHPQRAPRRRSTASRRSCSKRETIETEEFVALLDGKSEEEVFGADEPTTPPEPRPSRSRPTSAAASGPRPLPRPGPARRPGSTARGLDCAPTKPNLALRRSGAPCVARWTVMGIVNVTPDSFSDGGLCLDAEAAIAHGRELLAAGRGDPRHRRRVDAARAPSRSARRRSCGGSCPVLEGLRGARRRAVLDRHLEARGRARGARRRRRRSSTTSPRCAATRRSRRSCAERGADCCLMHMQGEPRTMQDGPALRRRRRRRPRVPRGARRVRGRRRRRAGAHPGSIPGSASARRSSTTSTLLRRLDELAALGLPGASSASRARRSSAR